MRTSWRMRCTTAAALLAAAFAGAAEAQDVRAQLSSRGLPPELVDGIAAVALEAAGRGLPTGPIAEKALEGWAKRAAANRILIVVQSFSTRMGDAQTAMRSAGIATLPGPVIAAAAEAMGRGMSGSQVVDVVRAGPAGADAAPALHVAAALAAQGMAMDQAVSVVATAMRGGRDANEILDMPSVMRAMQARGMEMPEIGRQLMQGAGQRGTGMMGPRSGLPGAGQRPTTPGGPRMPGELLPPGGGKHPR